MRSFLTTITTFASRLYRNPNPPDGSRHANDDMLSEELPPRFEYDPKYFFQRLLVSVGGKTKLASSTLTNIPYRWWLRWVLVALLLLITIFLTPQLLPKWLGFKWSSTTDFCDNRRKKIAVLKSKLDSLARVPQGARFVERTNQALKCMQDSVGSTWTGRNGRVKYPDECIPANARTKTKTTEACVGGQRVQVCLKLFGFIKLKCADAAAPRKCENITASDPNSMRRIAEINALRRVQQSAIDTNVTRESVKEISETANKAGERLINRLLIQIDIASNLYICYTVVAVLVGTPVIIYKRERSARVLGAALGLRKANFVLFVIILLTIYDSGVKVLRETNFPQLFRNFQNDPCYLDPSFSQTRLELIRATCGNITAQRTTINDRFASMTSVFYDAQLCEVSVVAERGPTENAKLVRTIDEERQRYSDGLVDGYVYPGSCNATQLNEKTAVPPDIKVSFAKAFLGSGILAQILLKGILASWLTHSISLYEPMTMHRGTVEIFGLQEDSASIRLTECETRSVVRFSRDKHLFPFFVTSILMVWEACIIIYSFVESARHTGILEEDFTSPQVATALNYTCSKVGRLVQK